MVDISHLNALGLHFSLKVTTDLLTICAPLFSHFKINYFCYVRFYSDGSRIYLSTHAKWIQYYVDNSLQNNLEHMKCYAGDDKVDKTLWLGFKDDDVFNAATMFDICNGISFYEKHEDSYSSYLFATSQKNKDIHHFYINNISTLKHFINYFKDKAWKIIRPDKNKKIYLTKKIDNIPIKNGLSNIVETKDGKNNFFIETRIRKLFYSPDNANEYFTEKEFFCLRYFLQHKTSKETAEIMNISQRTVESYIRIIKEKTGCHTKSELYSWLFGKNIIYNFY